MGCIITAPNHVIDPGSFSSDESSTNNAMINSHSSSLNNKQKKTTRLKYGAEKEFHELKERRASQHLVQNMVIENKNRDIRDFYDIDRMPVLGSGISGSVRICVHRSTKTKYALKALSKKQIKHDKLSQLREEIKFMTDLDHPNILRIQEYFETPDVIYLVLELCKGGELLDRLHQQKHHQYSERVACRYIYTMLSAISYCHAHNIVHRDLKLENFLFEDESPSSELKLIDFGLSHYFKPQEILHSAVGTPYYVAPEVLQENYDAKCDVWSIGVIAFMLLSGTPPFYGKTDAETLQSVRIGRWKFDENIFKPITAEAKNFITACLSRRVSKRPSAAEALKHPWFLMLKPTDSQTQHMDHDATLNIASRLKVFAKRSSLSKICMEVVAHTLQPDQIGDLRKEFMKLDSSHTGEITIENLFDVMKSHGSFSKEDLEYILAAIDLERNGKISYHEFLAATVSTQNITEENLRVAFEKMSNHNDYITKESLLDLLGSDAANVDPVDQMFAEVLPSVSTPSLHHPPQLTITNPKINYQQFKDIMKGGNSSPMIHSPYKTQRNKIGFWKNEDGNHRNNPNPDSLISNETVARKEDLIELDRSFHNPMDNSNKTTQRTPYTNNRIGLHASTITTSQINFIPYESADGESSKLLLEA